MTSLVTGGGGFLGLYIVEQLIERGERVRVFCRGEYPRLAELGCEVVRGDIHDEAAVVSAIDGIETVYHTAAVPGVWGPWQHYFETNTLGTRHVLAGCRRHGVRKLIYTSSPSVVFDGRSHLNADESLPYAQTFLCHYPHSKAIAEREVLAANGQGGLTTVALRPHLIWGSRDNHLIPRLIAKAKAGRLRRVGNGSNLISMSYVENAAAAHLQAADRLSEGGSAAGKPYFINEPEPVNLWGWIDELLAIAGLPPVRNGISANTATRIGAACEAIWTIGRLPGEPPMTRFLAAQLSQSHTYSVQAAERDFGYRPTVSAEEGLRRFTPELRQLAKRS
ncbi:MAG: NAD-dependent epimerase/dehydratase family protein [Planctomycetota bacterium]|nr:NAD-dependent epimerase/dehydratase family protein [Planctomycetaceae bacterium]MDQ3330865.1 NAD-dependent epimerase/dehydratase family protein [Planctomycetota bacterium]